MKRILVAEDDANIRETLADLLSGEGYEVTTAADVIACIVGTRNGETQGSHIAAIVVLTDVGTCPVQRIGLTGHRSFPGLVGKVNVGAIHTKG